MLKQEVVDYPALRWNISRIYEPGPDAVPDKRSVHVTIHHSSENLSGYLARTRLGQLRQCEREEWDWWDRDLKVEGWTPEATLVRALADNNAASLDNLLVEPGERQLAEDMVLVQVLESDDPWNLAVEAYDRGRGNLPELTELAEAPGSRWIDLTKAARRAAKTRYQRALREAAPPEGSRYAGKR